MSILRDHSRLCAGDWVEVRSKEEILRTLDPGGRLDGLPFMPEMFQYCQQRFRVWKRAHKTCDTVNKTGGRAMKDAVHLENLRCDGAAHGGCQAACLIFWKEAWLRKVDGIAVATEAEGSIERSAGPCSHLACPESSVWEAACLSQAGEETVYACQATELPKATSPLSKWKFSQYWEDFRSGNVSLGRLLRTTVFACYERLMKLGVGANHLRRLYDKVQQIRGGIPYPRDYGRIPKGQRTPAIHLGLQPGDWVRVKSFPEILKTLDEENRNRGLYFDAEEVPFCGGVYRVRSLVNQIINEKTGRMMRFKTGSVILENVYCLSKYSDRRLFCPRAVFPMWREVWLERVAGPSGEPMGGDSGADGQAGRTGGSTKPHCSS